MKIKTAPVIFMYLAYFIILAHAVIPHHHHASVVCIQTVATIHKHCSHDQSASQHTAHQECKLTHSEVLPAKSLNFQMPDCISLVLDVPVPIMDPVEDYSFLYPSPDIGVNSRYLKYATESSILRAPPTL